MIWLYQYRACALSSQYSSHGVSPGATTGGSSTSWKSGGAASSSPRLMMTPSGRVQDVSPVSVLSVSYTHLTLPTKREV